MQVDRPKDEDSHMREITENVPILPTLLRYRAEKFEFGQSQPKWGHWALKKDWPRS